MNINRSYLSRIISNFFAYVQAFNYMETRLQRVKSEKYFSSMNDKNVEISTLLFEICFDILFDLQ